MLTDVLIILGLILLNGFFALSELAVVSARPVRLRLLAKAGRRGAETALRLAEDPSRFLSSVQIGITLVGIFAGAYGGPPCPLRSPRVWSTFPCSRHMPKCWPSASWLPH